MVKNEKFRKVLAATLAVAVLTMGVPSMVFADDEKPAATDAKYTNTETEIDPDMREAADTAVEKATEAKTAADLASAAADKAEDEVKKAETAATDATTTAETADDNADKALDELTKGQAYVDKAEGDIAKDVDAAVDKINAEKVKAEAEKAKAEEAAAKAAEAKLEAETAKTEKAAKAAAEKAEAAAKEAQAAANAANTAYEAAKDTLATANTEYAAAVAAAQAEIDKYNTSINGFQTLASTANLATLKTQYEAAVANATKAKADAEAAAAKAVAAQDAAAIAADAAINFYVNPAQAEYDAKVAAEAAAKLEAEKAAQEKLNAQNAYASIVDNTTAIAKAAQDATVANLKQQMENAKAAYDSQKKITRKWQEFWNSGKYAEWKDAEKAYNYAKSDTAYNNAIDSALKGTSEYKALTAAEAAEAEKQVLVNTATQEIADAAVPLADATNTRDSYLADIKAAVDTDKVIEDIVQTVKTSSDLVNSTEYDADLYDWATEFYWLWESERWDAHDIREDLDDKYEGDIWDSLLNFWNPVSPGADTDKIIAAVEKSYRQQLLAAEEKLSMNEAYAADSKATQAEKDALSKELAAASSVARLSAANEKLAAAEQTLADAKAKLESIYKLELDVAAAKAKLDAAQAAVEAAKVAAEDAQKAADAAKQSAKEARAIADSLKDVRFFVLLKNTVFEPIVPDEGKSQPVENYTKLLGTVTISTIPNVSSQYISNKTIILEGIDETKGKTTSSAAVENKIKSLVYTGNDAKSYDDQMAAINAELTKQLAAMGLQMSEDQYVDWYEFKVESDGWHVDGAIATKKAPATEPDPDPSEDTFKLTVNYQYEDGTPITDPSIREGLANGANGSVEAIPVEGYTPDATEKNYSIDGNDAVITFVYVENEETPSTPPQDTPRRSNRTTQTTIPEETVPLAEQPAVIEDEPVAKAAEPVVKIEEEETPLADLPKTGGIGAGIFLLVGGALVAAGIGSRKKED